MSILDNNSTNVLSQSDIIAKNIIESTRTTFMMMQDTFNAGSLTFWDNPGATPTEIAQALGQNAKEVFELHYALGQFLAGIKPDSISRGMEVVRQFTINEDGTVTILEDTTPTDSTTDQA